MRTIRAFAPANISCAFKIHPDDNPRWRGSLGFGFTVNEGVTATVSPATTTAIFFNEQPIVLPTVSDVVSALTTDPITIQLSSPLPLGSGFGISGASALATAYAINALFESKKSAIDLAVIAHIAEAKNQTGLGDVINQYYGGCLAKFEPSSHFIATTLPVIDVPVYCISYGKIPTTTILGDATMTQKINSAATQTLATIQQWIQEKKAIQFEELVTLSKTFAIDSGLLSDKKTIETISAIEQQHGKASMIMLGNAVFSTIPFPGAKKLFISPTKAQVLPS